MGATRSRVMRMVLGYGFKLTLIGLPFGLAAALAVSHLLGSLLYGIQPADLTSFLGASVLAVLISTAACYSPARRAMNVEPAVALRSE